MVAQFSSETLPQTLLVPRPDPSDSDDVLLALQTARALEAQGEIREAARWLRRAADHAEMEGNDERVLALARAAADLTNMIGSTPAPGSAPSSVPPSNARERAPIQAPPAKPLAGSPAPSPRTPAPPAALSTKTTPPSSASASSPPRPPVRTPAPQTPARPAPPQKVQVRTSPPPTAPARGAFPHPASEATSSVARADKPSAQRTIRVAIPASVRNANVFVVRRLETGQVLPEGAVEALIVLPG